MPAVTSTILSNGQAMDPTYALISLDVEKEVGRIPRAELRIADGSAAKRQFVISDTPFFEPGARIQIKLRYEGEEDQTVFVGVVVRHGVEASSSGSRLVVCCKDAAVKLTSARKSAVYRQQSDCDIFKQIIEGAGLTVGKLPSSKPVHDEMVQYAATPWDFLLSRAEALGLVVVADAGTLSVHKLAEVAKVSGDAKYKFEYGMGRVIDFEFEADAESQPEAVESVAWDVKEQKTTDPQQAGEVALTPGNLHGGKLGQALGTGTLALSHVVPMAQDELRAWADARLARSRLSLLRGRLTLPGFAALNLLDPIEILGVGQRWNGKTVVTALRQRVDASGWVTLVQFGLPSEPFYRQPNMLDAPAAGLLPAVTGLQLGVVANFEADKDDELRVKVTVPSLQGAKTKELWARLASPDAGNGRGYCFRPETGDEVVLGFLNGDPRSPVILGAFFGSKNAAPAAMGSPCKENHQHGIVTKKGTTIGFVDSEKPKVFIKTAGENVLLLDDEAEGISLTDQHKNSITMGKDGIVITSAKDITLNAKGNVTIKGSKVDIQ